MGRAWLSESHPDASTLEPTLLANCQRKEKIFLHKKTPLKAAAIPWCGQEGLCSLPAPSPSQTVQLHPHSVTQASEQLTLTTALEC